MKELKVTTAIILSDQMKLNVENTFRKIYKEEVSFLYNVNPKIIGGIMVEDGDIIYNGTIINNLQKVNRIIRK